MIVMSSNEMAAAGRITNTMHARCCWLTLVATNVASQRSSWLSPSLLQFTYSQQCTYTLAFAPLDSGCRKFGGFVVRARNGPGRGMERLARALAAEEIGSTTTFISAHLVFLARSPQVTRSPRLAHLAHDHYLARLARLAYLAHLTQLARQADQHGYTSSSAWLGLLARYARLAWSAHLARLARILMYVSKSIAESPESWIKLCPAWLACLARLVSMVRLAI
jgi:hypothetical protein